MPDPKITSVTFTYALGVSRTPRTVTHRIAHGVHSEAAALAIGIEKEQMRLMLEILRIPGLARAESFEREGES